jgi:murein DD-endopeptidase MepM/ murein hydrolase activator NlpD
VRRFPALAGGLAAALTLAACSQQRAGGPAPISFGPESQAASAAGVVTVAAGDTLYEIARRYNVPARGLIEENGLQPPYSLRIGQRLLLPTARFHLVQKGDTLYAVSRMYQVDMAELARANRLQSPYNIRIGESLRLPATGGEPASGTAVAQAPVTPVAPAAPAVTARAPEPAAPSTAVAMAQPTPATAPAGGQPPERAPRPGTKPSSGASPAQPGVIASAAPPPAPVPERQVAAVPPPVPTAPAPAPTPAVQPAPPPSPPAAEEAPPRSSGRFAWPAQGKILSEFGPKSGGLHNDGINIAAPKGAPVFSAENGVVAYAGNELRGFGNLLLIRHADGWMTAYAHLGGMQVARGDKVTRGQKIGTVGSTGSVGEPQLHFEVRKGSRAVDPREFLDGKKNVSRAVSQGDRQGPG